MAGWYQLLVIAGLSFLLVLCNGSAAEVILAPVITDVRAVPCCAASASTRRLRTTPMQVRCTSMHFQSTAVAPGFCHGVLCCACMLAVQLVRVCFVKPGCTEGLELLSGSKGTVVASVL